MEEVLLSVDRCRLCLSAEGPLLPIVYGDSHSLIGNTIYMPTQEKICSVTSIKVTRQALLPNVICQKCDEYMNDYLNFKQRCISTNNDLQKYYCTLFQKNTNSSTAKFMKTEAKETPMSLDPAPSNPIESPKPKPTYISPSLRARMSHSNPDGESTTLTAPGKHPSLARAVLKNPEEIIIPVDYKEMFILEDDKNSVDVKSVIDSAFEASEAGNSKLCTKDEVDLPEQSSDRTTSILDLSRGEGLNKVVSCKLVKQRECSVCKKKFNNSSLLYKHEKSTFHNRNCLLCTDLVFKNRRERTQHMKTCHAVRPSEGLNSKPVECSVCKEVFNNITLLNKHERTTLHNRNCLLCTDLTFNSRRECTRHIKKCHTESPHSKRIKTVKGPTEMKLDVDCSRRKIFLCNICAQSCSNQKNLNKHLQLHEYSEFRGSRIFCKSCEYSSTATLCIFSHLLKAHNISMCERKCECDSCGKMFRSKGGLISHIQRNHLKEKFKCNQCASEFMSSRYLRVHELRNHSNREKTNKCPICSKTFLKKDTLTNHMRTHTGETPFVCSFCNRAFTLDSNLRAHLRLHTGDKPYKCEVCGLAFRHNVTKKNHMKYHQDVPGVVYTPPVNNRKYVKKTAQCSAEQTLIA